MLLHEALYKGYIATYAYGMICIYKFIDLQGVYVCVFVCVRVRVCVCVCVSVLIHIAYV